MRSLVVPVSQAAGYRTIEEKENMSPTQAALDDLRVPSRHQADSNSSAPHRPERDTHAPEQTFAVQPSSLHRPKSGHGPDLKTASNPFDTVRDPPFVVVDTLLYEEKVAHPDMPWVDRAKAIQHRLRCRLMKDILDGESSDGTPPAIPLLEILDAKIRESKQRG